MKREALYLGDGDAATFGWYHSEPQAPARDRVAVLCAPIGHEYTRAHRSIRHLADRLARAGIPALRYDHHGIGDSPGGDLDPGRVAAWVEGIRTAIAKARELSGREHVLVVGLRLGATLAALASRGTRIDDLVLWNPCVSGRAYVRELQAIAMSAERAGSAGEGALESAGFVMTGETIATLKAINLAETLPAAGRILVAWRDDAAPSPFYTPITQTGAHVEVTRLPGWSAMMAEHQFTVVPDAALDAIVAWAVEGAREARAFPNAALPLPAQVQFQFETPERRVVLMERACRFGAEGKLVGILAEPAAAQPGRTAILIFNAGAVHHVGPNRVSVAVARSLAAAGFPSLRFDLEGIGDSVLTGAGRENHPYPQTALADARAALDYLKGLGFTRFVALGLCSGAHASFHTALALEDEAIVEAILINPLTFYWEEGMSLETTRHFEDAVQYKRSMRNPRRWLKLLRGNVNFGRLAQVVLAQVKSSAKAQRDALREIVAPHKAPRLSRDLKRLAQLRRPVTLFVAEGDPGREILMANARRAASQGMKAGRIRVEMIPEADHTFSQLKPRHDLVRRLNAHFARQGTFTQGT